MYVLLLLGAALLTFLLLRAVMLWGSFSPPVLFIISSLIYYVCIPAEMILRDVYAYTFDADLWVYLPRYEQWLVIFFALVAILAFYLGHASVKGLETRFPSFGGERGEALSALKHHLT